MYSLLCFLNTERLLLTALTGVNHMLRLQAGIVEKQLTARRILQKVAVIKGLVVTDGKFYKVQRKAMDPAFKVRMIKDIYNLLFWSKAGRMMEVLQKEHGDQEASSTVKMDDIIGRTVFYIVGEACMNHDWKALKSPDTYCNTLRGFRTSFEPSHDTRNWIIYPSYCQRGFLTSSPRASTRSPGRRFKRSGLLVVIPSLRRSNQR
jgi:hypothetical protein